MSFADPSAGARVAIVTGGTHGIGRAVCLALAGAEMWVAACGRDKSLLRTLETESIHGYPCDVRDGDRVRETVAAVAAARGRIDVLVNAAGVSMPEPLSLEAVDTALWQRIIETNLTGTFNFCRAVLPHMRRRGTGLIVNILSTAAFRSNPGNGPYTVSKYGARALSECLAEETKGSGIKVTSVSPGPVNSDIWTHKKRPPAAEERARMLKPEDIAEIVLFLYTRPGYVHIENVTVVPLFPQSP